MEQELFGEYIQRSLEFGCYDYSGFWEGYRRGLRRHFYGEIFGSETEHKIWMEYANEKNDKARRDRGLGYRVGHAGKNPTPVYKTRMKSGG